MLFNHKKNLYAYIKNAMLNRFIMNEKEKRKTEVRSNTFIMRKSD